MTQTLRGHPIYWDGKQFRYYDTGEPTVGNRRPCGHCGLADTPEGHDGCLCELAGVMNACCGHGSVRDAYVQFPDGSRVAGFQAVQHFKNS